MKTVKLFLKISISICLFNSCLKETINLESNNNHLIPNIFFPNPEKLEQPIQSNDSLKIEFFVNDVTDSTILQLDYNFDNSLVQPSKTILINNFKNDTLVSFYVNAKGYKYAGFKISLNDKNGFDTIITKAFNIKYFHNYGSVTDIDGNTYKTLKYGNQTWMVDNLRTTRLNNGNKITHIFDKEQWRSTDLLAYSTYNNTQNEDSILIEGLLYNFNTIKSENLCPIGWHVPTRNEWETFKAETINEKNGDEHDGLVVTLYSEKLMSNNYNIVPGNYIYNSQGFNSYSFARENMYSESDFPKITTQLYWAQDSSWCGVGQFCNTLPKGEKFAYFGNLGLTVRCVKD